MGAIGAGIGGATWTELVGQYGRSYCGSMGGVTGAIWDGLVGVIGAGIGGETWAEKVG